MAWWLGVFFASGASLALAGLWLPHPAYPHTTATALLSISAYPIAALLFLFGRRLSMTIVQVLTATGSLFVTVAIVLGGNSQLAGLSPLFYMWVPIFAFTYFSSRAAICQVAWIAASFSVSVGLNDGVSSISRSVVALGVLAVTSAAVHSLVSEIRRLARTDPLTGLANRRVFAERLQSELIRTQRTHTSLCVVIIDLDGFKEINDRLGHQAGDELLVRIGTSWLPELRAGDCLARYGGDEFALVLPNATTADAADVIERFRIALADLSFSAGIAAGEPTDDPDDIVKRADNDLYNVKRTRTGNGISAPQPAPSLPACDIATRPATHLAG
jgi:diguanylate cyclase (GGDEF)-like protein